MRFALEQVAHLLDAGMRVRQRPLAALDLADEHLELLRADGFGARSGENFLCPYGLPANTA
jgi:hypothetical protein